VVGFDGVAPFARGAADMEPLALSAPAPAGAPLGRTIAAAGLPVSTAPEGGASPLVRAPAAARRRYDLARVPPDTGATRPTLRADDSSGGVTRPALGAVDCSGGVAPVDREDDMTAVFQSRRGSDNGDMGRGDGDGDSGEVRRRRVVWGRSVPFPCAPISPAHMGPCTLTDRGVPPPPAASLPPLSAQPAGCARRPPRRGALLRVPPPGRYGPLQPHRPIYTRSFPLLRGGECPLRPTRPPKNRGGRHRLCPGRHPGPVLWGIPVSCPGPPVTFGPGPPALGRRDGDPLRMGNYAIGTPGPHNRGTRSLPVTRGHVDSRSQPVGSGLAETAPGPRESSRSYERIFPTSSVVIHL